MDEPTYLGPTAAAELAALAKAELGKKAGKDIATAEADGLMSATDKVKLDGVEDGATKTIVDDAMSETSTNPVQNKVVMKYINSRGSLPPVSDKNDTMLIQVVHGAYALRTKESIFPVDDALDTESKNAVENCVIARRFEMLSEVTLPATSERDGLMSKDDKAKLDDVETGANKTVVDATLDAGSANPVQNKAVKDALDNKADKTALDNKADTTVATASANGLMSAADKKKLDSVYDVVATSTDGETFDITPAQLHEKLKGVPTTCAIKVVDTIIPLYRVQLQSGGDTRYIFQITKDNGFWEPNTRLAYTASAGGTYAGTTWVKSEYDLLAITPSALKFTGAANAQFDGSKDVTIDIPTGEGSVRYDETQKLTSDQKLRARQNIGALREKWPYIYDGITLLPRNADGAQTINITPTAENNAYALVLDGGPENVFVLLAGLETPTDAQTDAAATVEYVKAKIAALEASGGIDVDDALSATSTNPVQNKVITSALTGKAGTAVATESANGLMSRADKTKLDGIEAGANKTIVDATLDASSTNPVQNKAVKAAIDAKADKTALDAKADKTALDAKMDKSGGTFTGNVYGKYFCGTWLQSSAASDLGRTPGKIAVLDDSGWVYYRTPSELFSDLGITNAIKSYVDTAIVAAINNAY